MNEPRLFLVRVWRHLNQFHAAVRGVDQHEPRLFNEPAQLGEFLHEASAETAAAPAAERNDAPAKPASALANARQTPHD